MLSFQYLRARTLDEALELLQKFGSNASILAGGTDLLVSLRDGIKRPDYVIDVKPIPEMHDISVASDGGLTMGAGVTINQLLEFGDLPRGMLAIRQAASSLGSYQVRSRATVGGNLCNASPACDLGPPLLVLGAVLKVVSKQGDRLIPVRQFFEGVKTTCLRPDEVVTEIRVPPAETTISVFLKRKRIRGHDLAIVNAAGALSEDGRLRIALGAVAPRPLLIDDLDQSMLKQPRNVIEIVLSSISPIDDVRGSALYRRYMVETLVSEIIRHFSGQHFEG